MVEEDSSFSGDGGEFGRGISFAVCIIFESIVLMSGVALQLLLCCHFCLQFYKIGLYFFAQSSSL